MWPNALIWTWVESSQVSISRNHTSYRRFWNSVVITFCMSRRRCKMYCDHVRLCVCLCVCVSVRGHMPTVLHGPRCNIGAWLRLPPSCALLGGFAIGARVALLWHHNANPSYKLMSKKMEKNVAKNGIRTWRGLRQPQDDGG